MNQPVKTIEWIGDLDGFVRMVEQTLLPERFEMLEVRDAKTMWEAIKRLAIRGAPAIGIGAAMGLVLGVRDHRHTDRAVFDAQLDAVSNYLAACRPTAVNLSWALKRMKGVAANHPDTTSTEVCELLLAEANAIRDEDAAMCRAIGAHGAGLIPEGAGILTHCNAGGLATAEYGTALAPIYTAHDNNRRIRVYADETRPLLQGSRLTAWELDRAGVDVTVICDNMAGQLMKCGKVDLVITGADRIAANGDAANKIGTYGLAVLANAHDIPFYIAAPSSTFDFDTPTGDDIPIESRDPDEIRRGFGRLTAPANVKCHSPAFDVTPARLIRGLITERGVITPVTRTAIARTLDRQSRCTS